MKRIAVNLYYAYTPDVFEKMVTWIASSSLFNYDEYTHQSDNMTKTELLKELSFKSVLTRGVSGNNIDNSEVLFIGANNRDYKLLFISFVKEVEDSDLTIIENIQSEIEKYINTLDFLCGFLYDYDFVKWQSEKNIDEYKKHGIDTSNLNIIKNENGDEEIDVSNNWGKAVFVLGMNFKVAWGMLFGKLFYDSFIGKDKLIQFPKAHSITEYPNAVILIKLYENPFLSYEDMNIQRLKEFSQWIRVDELIKGWQDKYKRLGYDWRSVNK